MGIKKSFGSEFKAKVGLAAIREVQTIAEISSEHGVHPTQIHRWKRVIQEGSGRLFQEGFGVDQGQAELIEKLYRNIGELKVENDWLKKKLGL